MNFTAGEAKTLREKHDCNKEGCSEAQTIGSRYCYKHQEVDSDE